jgi:ABC 3 transport family
MDDGNANARLCSDSLAATLPYLATCRVFRKKFLMISINHEKAEDSVAIAGVLLVFCYLIVPSVGAMLFADRIGPRLAIGWTMGTLVSALGCYLSVQLDTPTGATIVVTFGGILVLMFFVHLFVHHRRGHALDGARAAQRELSQEGAAETQR